MIALANLANITGTYFFLLIGGDAAAGTEWATIAVGCAWLAVSVALGVRGVAFSSRVQIALLRHGPRRARALHRGRPRQGRGRHRQAPSPLTPSLSSAGTRPRSPTAARYASGLLLAIVFFWGWDGPAAVVEESRGGTGTPRTALVLSVIALLGCYLIVTVAMLAGARRRRQRASAWPTPEQQRRRARRARRRRVRSEPRPADGARCPAVCDRRAHRRRATDRPRRALDGRLPRPALPIRTGRPPARHAGCRHHHRRGRRRRGARRTQHRLQRRARRLDRRARAAHRPLLHDARNRHRVVLPPRAPAAAPPTS